MIWYTKSNFINHIYIYIYIIYIYIYIVLKERCVSSVLSITMRELHETQKTIQKTIHIKKPGTNQVHIMYQSSSNHKLILCKSYKNNIQIMTHIDTTY